MTDEAAKIQRSDLLRAQILERGQQIKEGFDVRGRRNSRN